jgi:hypothetical protein
MFWSALRRWGERAVAAGFLTIDAIKNRDPAACTLPPAAFSFSPIPEVPEQRAVPQAPADEAAQQEASREIPAKICAAKNLLENSAENLEKPPAHTPAR